MWRITTRVGHEMAKNVVPYSLMDCAFNAKNAINDAINWASDTKKIKFFKMIAWDLFDLSVSMPIARLYFWVNWNNFIESAILDWQMLQTVITEKVSSQLI